MQVPAARLANTTVQRALGFGCPLTLGASETYERTQDWARAFARHGFDGVLFRLSHDPGAKELGVAIFGPTGESPEPPPWATTLIGAALIDEARRLFGYRFADDVLELIESPLPPRPV